MAEPLLVKAIINRNLPNNKLFSDANVNQVDNQGRTPLYWASKYGSIEWVKSLLNKGAKINKAEKNGKNHLLNIRLKLLWKQKFFQKLLFHQIIKKYLIFQKNLMEYHYTRDPKNIQQILHQLIV